MKRLSLCAAALMAALCFTPARAQLSGSTQATNYQNDSAHTGSAQLPGFAPPLRQRWAVNFGEPASYPVIADGRVFVTVRKPLSTYGTRLYALDAWTGEIMWSADLGGTYWWSALCYENGRVFALNYDGVLRAFSAWNGDLIWSRQLAGQWSFDSAPTVGGGVIYTAGAGSAGTLYAVSAETGAVLWTAPVANGNSSSPALGIEGVYVSYACLRAYGFAPGNGALLWRNLTGCSGGGGKTTALYNDRLYARDSSLGNAVFDAQTGAQTGTFVSRTIPAFNGTTGYFMNGQQSSLGSKLEARDLEDNANLLWSFGGDGRLMTAPLVVNGHVYVGSTAGKLYALEKATGSEVWSTSVGAELAINDEHGVGQPPAGLAAADGLLVVPTKTSLVAYERDLDALVQWGEKWPAPNAAGWNNTSVTLPFTIDQAGDHLNYSPEGPLRFVEEGANQTQDVGVEFGHAGDFRTYTSPAVNIDATQPTTSAVLSSPAGPARDGWFPGPVTVTLAATDNVSGVRETTLQLDGPIETYTGPFTLSADGLYGFSFRSVDRADNEERTQHVFFAIDANPPVTQAAVAGTPGANGWYKSAVQVTFSADDAGAGLDATYYSIDGGPAQLYAYTPITVSGAGAHTVSYWSTDVVGHTEAARTLAVNIDAVAPATALSAAGTEGGGWYRGSVEITLTPSDAHSGVAATRYAVDGGAAQTYTGAFTVNGDGTHTVNYWSTDRAGNAEAAQSSVVKIDSTAPATEAAVSGTPGAGGWYQTSARVTLSATDAHSGVAATYYALDGGAQQTYSAPFDVPAGSHTIRYWSVDAAGGAEQQRTLSVNVDAGAPATTLSAAGTPGGGDWYRGSVQVTLTAADAHSGVATTRYSVDGGPAQAYAGAFTVSGNGRHQVSYWSVDHAGNAEPQRTSEVNIDFNVPNTLSHILGPLGGPGYYRGSVQFELTAEDSLSGVASIHYRVGGGSAQTYAGAFMVTGDGTHLVEYWSVDVAGNVANATGSTIRIDSTAPVTEAAAAGPAGDNGWYRGLVLLTLSAADAFSGVGRSYYAVNGGSPQTYSGPFGVAADGAHTINFWSEDKAFNTEERRALIVRVDANAPAITAAANPATRPKGKSNVSVTISGRITDAASGVRAGSANFFVTDEYGVAQPSGPVVVQPDGSYSFTLSLPATRNSRDTDGHVYTITVRALDQAGNAGAASAVFTIL